MKLSMIQNLAIWGDSLLKGIIFDEKTSRYKPVSYTHLDVYKRQLLDRLPYREKACGFISGKQELLNWEKSDLFQFYYDTLPIIGSLNSLKEYFTAADVRRAIRIGACNIYHGCMHNMVHEKSWELLKGLYKSAAFTLQAAGFLQTGKYERRRKDLLNHLLPEDQAILLIGQTLKNTNLTERKEFELSLIHISGKKSGLRCYGGIWPCRRQF